MESQSAKLAVIEDKVDRIDSKIDDIIYAIHGNGDPGLKTRVDRLEQNHSRFKWVAGAICALFTGTVAELFRR